MSHANLSCIDFLMYTNQYILHTSVFFPSNYPGHVLTFGFDLIFKPTVNNTIPKDDWNTILPLVPII